MKIVIIAVSMMLVAGVANSDGIYENMQEKVDAIVNTSSQYEDNTVVVEQSSNTNYGNDYRSCQSSVMDE